MYRLRCSCSVFLICILNAAGHSQEARDTDLVGHWRDDATVTPVNQLLTPVGKFLPMPGMRPQVIALSPNGKLLVVAGKTHELVILDPESGEVSQHVPFPEESQLIPIPPVASGNILRPDTKGQVSYTGLVFSADGKSIYMSNVDGSIKVFSVDDANQVSPSRTIPLPLANAPRRKQEIPSGLGLSADGSKLYVCGNLSNQLLELDVADGRVTRAFDVGVAPYDVIVTETKAFVSNWGGRRPVKGETIGPAGRGTSVVVDSIRHIANNGSVSVIDLETGEIVNVLTIGLHPCGLAISPDRKFVCCANAASDTISVIDVASVSVIDKIWCNRSPSDLFGASPNALVFAPDGERLFVANGTQNAIGVYHFEPDQKGGSVLEGLIPVGWFPGAIALDTERQQLCVANIKGLTDSPRKRESNTEAFNSHQYCGSVSLVPIPTSADVLHAYSERVAKNGRFPAIADAARPPRPNQTPVPIPERIGEPSLIEHVVYIIKENRTYDQVLGDIEQGRGNSSLCIFGDKVTPNQHKMANEFVLLDNTYCAGILSADGHNWSTSSIATDYLEKSFAGFPRSYPDGMGIDEADALAYSPAGFLWDNAIVSGKSIRNYGEFMMPTVRWRDPNKSGTPNFLACYRAWKGKTDEIRFESTPAIESIRTISPSLYVGWEMSVPDQVRADFFINELKEFESKGTYPSLVIVCLPNDHTSGTTPKCPTPASCMADNDLAFGRIVDALSHSAFWPKMAIFAIEDDPQAGWDHVSGYRTTAYCISPYAKRRATVSTQYNTTSVIRTIEQILGMPPMNQFDASATPMFDCFTNIPNSEPFAALPNLIPLDQMNPDPLAIRDPVLRQDAIVSSELNWSEIDRVPEDVLNRILWRATKGTSIPYPEWAVSSMDDD